jgi:hypothetical protein
MSILNAQSTRFELAVSSVTGRRVNQATPRLHIYIGDSALWSRG